MPNELRGRKIDQKIVAEFRELFKITEEAEQKVFDVAAVSEVVPELARCILKIRVQRAKFKIYSKLIQWTRRAVLVGVPLVVAAGAISTLFQHGTLSDIKGYADFGSHFQRGWDILKSLVSRTFRLEGSEDADAIKVKTEHVEATPKASTKEQIELMKKDQPAVGGWLPGKEYLSFGKAIRKAINAMNTAQEHPKKAAICAVFASILFYVYYNIDHHVGAIRKPSLDRTEVPPPPTDQK